MADHVSDAAVSITGGTLHVDRGLDFIENRTFEEIRIGDSGEYTFARARARADHRDERLALNASLQVASELIVTVDVNQSPGRRGR